MSEKESDSTKGVFRIECNYDEAIQSALLKSVFDYRSSEEKKRSRMLAVLFGVFTLIGFGLAYLQGGKFTFGHVIIFGAGFILFLSLLFLSQLSKQRATFIASELNRWKAFPSENNKMIFEFTEETFSISDPEVSSMFRWSYFSQSVRQGGFLFLHDRTGGVTGISSVMMGLENFNKAVEIIQSKVKYSNQDSARTRKLGTNEILDEKIQ